MLLAKLIIDADLFDQILKLIYLKLSLTPASPWETNLISPVVKGQVTLGNKLKSLSRMILHILNITRSIWGKYRFTANLE